MAVHCACSRKLFREMGWRLIRLRASLARCCDGTKIAQGAIAPCVRLCYRGVENSTLTSFPR